MLLSAALSLHTLCFVGAMSLHLYSDSLPNPYTNIYREIATCLFIGTFALWLVCLVWCVIRLSRNRRLPMLAWPWLVCFSLYFGWFLLNFLRFMALGL